MLYVLERRNINAYYLRRNKTISKAEVFNQSFADDAEKMIDFNTLTKEEFLQSYSYLTEAEYEATLQEVNGIK